jgi:hypothetical protein
MEIVSKHHGAESGQLRSCEQRLIIRGSIYDRLPQNPTVSLLNLDFAKFYRNRKLLGIVPDYRWATA